MNPRTKELLLRLAGLLENIGPVLAGLCVAAGLLGGFLLGVREAFSPGVGEAFAGSTGLGRLVAVPLGLAISSIGKPFALAAVGGLAGGVAGLACYVAAAPLITLAGVIEDRVHNP